MPPVRDSTANFAKRNRSCFFVIGSLKKIAFLHIMHEFLASIRTKAEGYVIFADACVLSQDELNRLSIVFKKIPRDIARL